MIKKGDIFQYTSIVGDYRKYYVDSVYEAQERILQSGHIKLVGHVNKTPLTFIRPHSFNPKLRNIPNEEK